MTQNGTHKGGRKSLPIDEKATTANWTITPSFRDAVAVAAKRDGFVSTSEWVRQKLLPHLK